MKSAIGLGLAITLAGAAVCFAQDSAVGTYKGSFEVQGTMRYTVMGVTLVIASIADGKLTGTGTYHAGPCRGDYPLVGSLKDNAIGLRSTSKGGAGGDCSFGFKGKVEGNQLVGNMGKYEVVLQK